MTLSESPLILSLVRHGQTASNTEHRLAGWRDDPLSSRGLEQASWLRASLDGEAFDGVWSSDLIRAVETARLAIGEPVTDRRLRELNLGDLEGKTWDVLESTHAEGLMLFQDFQAPNGESLEDLGARVMAFVDGLGSGRHLIFTHGGVIRWLLQRLGTHRLAGNCARVDIDWRAQEIMGVTDCGV